MRNKKIYTYTLPVLLKKSANCCSSVEKAKFPTKTLYSSCLISSLGLTSELLTSLEASATVTASLMGSAIIFYIELYDTCILKSYFGYLLLTLSLQRFGVRCA